MLLESAAREAQNISLRSLRRDGDGSIAVHRFAATHARVTIPSAEARGRFFPPMSPERECKFCEAVRWGSGRQQRLRLGMGSQHSIQLPETAGEFSLAKLLISINAMRN